MKHLFSGSALLLLFLFLLMTSDSLHAHEAAPHQEISISFDLKAAAMRGTSVVTLPEGHGMQLYFGELEEVTVVITQGGEEKTVPPGNGNNILTLPPAEEEQKISLSWLLRTTNSGHGSDNMINVKGITLAGFWHPMADQDMTFSLTAALPPKFSGITEADELIVSGRGDNRVLKASYPHPLQSINFVAGPYSIRSRKAGATTVYSYFFKEDAGLAEGYLAKAVDYLKRYEKLIGPFPYNRYSIVENRLPTGYGMPTFTLLGQAVIRLPFIKDTSLGHEILHSWFGNAVRLDGTGNWCEGLTTYLADQSYEADQGGGEQYRKNQLLRYQSYVHQDNITALIDFRHGGDSQPMARKMRAIGYDKASMLFHMLRKELGDNLFFTAVRQLYSENRFKRIGWVDIESVFSGRAGRDLSLFFGQWLLRNDVPAISADSITVKQEKGQFVLRFHLLQHDEDPYRLQVPIHIRTLAGLSKKTVQSDRLDQEISITMDSLPTELILDPEFDLMRRLDLSEQYPAWVEFMGADQKTVVLPDDQGRDVYAPLLSSLERMGCRLISGSELKNSELASGSFLFLGDSGHTPGLFASPDHPDKGFTLDVRKNPLSPGQVMVLVTSGSAEETSRIVRKLSHYGKYSYLHFVNGRIQQKQMTPAGNGILFTLYTPPAGIPVQQVQGFQSIIDDLLRSRVVYVGEMHTSYGSHILQLQVIEALHRQNPNLAIGMEMFPRTSQQALDEYIDGIIDDEREFIKRSNYFKVWGYDYRMYRDIIGFAKANDIPLVGLNLAKEIVSTVFQNGATDNLTDEQLAQVAAERDLELPGYSQRLRNIHAMHKRSPHGSNFAGFIQAQSMWDETMAESVVNYLQANPEKRMVVLAGTGHVYKDSGIPPRVLRRMKVRQSVLIADNGMDRGIEEGKQLDYLMFTGSLTLPSAGKIGVVLNETGDSGEKKGEVTIIQISPHGKAGEAGLQEQDRIVAVNGFPVGSVGDLRAGLIDLGPGDLVTLQIVRDDATLDIEVELSDMDKSAMMKPPGHP